MTTSFVIETSMRVDWYLRLANVIIDLLAIYIFAVILMVLVYLLGVLGFEELGIWMHGFNDSDYNVLGLGIMMAYYMIMEIMTQRTFGKIITGTMVIAEDGSKASAKAIIGRSLCRLFSIEAISFLRAYPRGWHDSASGTYVVRAKKYKEFMEMKNSFELIGVEQV